MRALRHVTLRLYSLQGDSNVARHVNCVISAVTEELYRVKLLAIVLNHDL